MTQKQKYKYGAVVRGLILNDINNKIHIQVIFFTIQTQIYKLNMNMII